MAVPTHYRDDAKRAAVDQWTADPCGVIEGEPGTGAYFERLLVSRDEYVRRGANGPWMAELLDYGGARGLRVLDVGCGQGTDLYRYAAAGADVTGIDLTPRHVELAKDHLSAMGVTAEITQGDAEHLPFPAATFDRVSSNGVLHHTPDMLAALREIRRVLRPGGRVTIIVYHRDSEFFWLSQVLRSGIIERRLLRENIGDILSDVERSSIDAKPLVRVYSRRQLRGMMQSAGFVNVRQVVRHEAWELSNQLPATVRNLLGRVVGWYVIATATR